MTVSTGPAPFDKLRLSALQYAVNAEAEQYVAIMRVFTDGTAGLLSDLSASEVADRLQLTLDADVVEARLSYLVQAGNLARSPRESEARSIREYLKTRSRYQLTQRGELVHRQVEELLAATDEVREVSTEMLGAILAGLRTLEAYDGSALRTTDPDVVAGQVSTVFAQFERLLTSTRQFYTSLAPLLFRFDLERQDFQAYKAALIDYLQRFVDQIARTMPQVTDVLAVLDPAPLLARAAEGARLVGSDGAAARRSSGLELSDWDGLRTWFLGAPGRRSDAEEVRTLATRAMRALLVNLRRLATSTDREVSRYADLVRLARWFDESDPDQAAALWAAAFGLYPCRHLGFGATGEPAPATSSWWRAPVADVPVMLRHSGERKTAGATARREDFSAVKAQRLRERARLEAERTEALAELVGVAELDGARLSAAARATLLELHARALSDAGGPLRGPASTVVTLAGGGQVRLTVTPGDGTTTIHGPDGTLVLHGLHLQVEGVSA